MSDKMRGIKFSNLMKQILEGYKKNQEIFGVQDFYKHDTTNKNHIFSSDLEVPFGPAAGPHTQLAHNLVAAYVAGSRFFELKTVQILDGEDLPVDKPCIRADDECYNVEWSTELYVPQAIEEYVKGWFAIKLISKEFGFGDPNGFIFNMSVGYNLEGIQSKKVDSFIEAMKNAENTEIFKECKKWALEHIDEFDNIDKDYIESISSNVCNSITLSTMHGCPRNEIEKIIEYLLKEKKINTYLKCNPTLLGYDFVRKTMDNMGYEYMTFDTHGFESDLQFDQACELISKMKKLANDLGLEFGVKLSNTFHVKIDKGQLPGQDMYMSGKALYPLTINLAAKLARQFNGELPISFSGGADLNNIKEIYQTGIWPITVATILLRPQGYKNIKGLVAAINSCSVQQDQKVDVEKLEELAKNAIVNPAYRKVEALKQRPLAKFKEEYEKCSTCKVCCGTCVNVCPNRANTTLMVEGVKKILHLDQLCNECGNCYIFCPEKTAPYKARMTLFASKEDLMDSTNDGFVYDKDEVTYRFDSNVVTSKVDEAPNQIKDFVLALLEQRSYLL